MDEALAQEARDRWGDTEQYRIAAARTASYTDEQWQEAKAEADAIARDFASAMKAGVEAINVAERHRLHISTWYYPCSPEMHAQLGELYVADPRFAAYWEEYGEGLAGFVQDAIRANSGRGVSPSA